jgi:hypothetical protein
VGKRGFGLLDLEKSNASMGLEAAKNPKDFKKLRLFMGVQFLGNQSSGQLNQLLATSKVISDV